MSRCVDLWELADEGECEYCGTHTKVFPEPFGQQNACRPCWELICYGEDE